MCLPSFSYVQLNLAEQCHKADPTQKTSGMYELH